MSLIAVLLLLTSTGCEVDLGDEKQKDEQNQETPAPAEAATTESAPAPTVAETPTAAPPVGSIDDLNISHARLLGPHADVNAPRAAVTKLLFSANVSSGKVKMNFETLHWPSRSGKKTIDGSVFLFWVRGGQVIGGYFDAHSVGQTTKGLENVYGGYIGEKPAKGETVYFCLVSLDGRQRTNVKRSDTPW